MSRRGWPRALRTLSCAAILSLALNAFSLPAIASRVSAASPTTTKVPKPRTVEGVVHSKSGTPIQGAVVYLKDTRSLAVKSYLTDAEGNFHFRQLSLDTDYDLWAELNGARSKTRHISQFNSKPGLHFTLKLKAGK